MTVGIELKQSYHKVVNNNSKYMFDLRLCPICKVYMRHSPPLSVEWLKCDHCGYLKLENEIINLNEFYKNRDIDYKKEFSTEILENSMKLLTKVNMLLKELGISKASVSSGWRPPSLNATIKNAAKASAHQIGMAIDIIDSPDQQLAKLIEKHPELLKKHDLWMEDKGSTKGTNTNWVHLDIKERADRPIRIFKP